MAFLILSLVCIIGGTVLDRFINISAPDRLYSVSSLTFTQHHTQMALIYLPYKIQSLAFADYYFLSPENNSSVYTELIFSGSRMLGFLLGFLIAV